MKRTKFFKPYNDKKTVCTLKSSGAGVYIIKHLNKLVYIGYSATDVKKTEAEEVTPEYDRPF